MRQNSLSGQILAFRLAMLAVLLAAIALATAWPALSAERERTVEIKLFSFPKSLEVSPGTTVVWTNRDAIEHSVTAGTPGEPQSAFDSGLFVQGESFGHRFDEAGEFAYFCTRHESMRGVVTVRDME